MKNTFVLLILIVIFNCCSNNSRFDNEAKKSENLTEIDIEKIIIEFHFAYNIRHSIVFYDFIDNSIFIWKNQLLTDHPTISIKHTIEDEYIKISNNEAANMYKYIKLNFKSEDYKNQYENYEDGFFIDVIFLYHDEKIIRFQLTNSFTKNQKTFILTILKQIINNTNSENNANYFKKVHGNFENKFVLN